MRALITTQPRSREGDHPVPVSPKFVGEEEGAGEERILIKRQLVDGAGNEDAAVETVLRICQMTAVLTTLPRQRIFPQSELPLL